MKSYLNGNPPLKLALNDDLIIGKPAPSNVGVTLDDCNFHECVNTSDFDLNRTLKINPPDGEFIVMNYRVTSDFQAPFRVFPFIDEVSNYKLEMTLKIRACFPKETCASYVVLKFPVPKLTSNVHNELTKVNKFITFKNECNLCKNINLSLFESLIFISLIFIYDSSLILVQKSKLILYNHKIL